MGLNEAQVRYLEEVETRLSRETDYALGVAAPKSRPSARAE
jgi:hypothetical protein